MALLIDFIIVGIILLFTFIGYKRGLVKIAFSLCTFIIALIVSLILYKPISTLVINNTEIDEKIESTIIEKILPEGVSQTEEIELKDEDIYNTILKGNKHSIQSIAETFSTKIIESIVMLLIFIIAKIVLRFVTFLADLIAKLPLLNSFNHLGGTIFGFLQGGLIVLVVFALISLFTPMIEESLINNINNSKIGSTIYNHNILIDLISK